ncbi:MAG: polysaccharide biosynthesis C-terminal domain-containing protein, partial [Clostridia bacterium]|nr:polysaccharide biosynthesis C-terminal domain-containing protein [Clostridia bacterium]
MEKIETNSYREKKAKRNIAVTFLGQFILVVCGLVTPRVLLKAFGSEVYGATTSITQFLGYIMLIEGGIGAVAKAALYKPLAEKDWDKMSLVLSEVRKYFRIIAYAFMVHVLILACCFHKISDVKTLDWLSTFLLVIVISLSSFAEYFFGISNAVFLQADQKVYISNSLSYFATVCNMFMIILLTRLNLSIIVVKLVSSVVFAIKPFYLYWYVKKNYRIKRHVRSKEKLLKDKWVGLGQHIAYFLHYNTDVFVLTIVARKMTLVAVYAVHFMVVSQIQKITAAFSTGMDSVFGDMYARGEKEGLQKTFGLYETMISIVSIVLFAVTAVMLVPFVRIYTAGLTDADYYQPFFALLLVIASLVTQLSAPYSTMSVAAGRFRQTRLGSYGEAAINIVLSLILIWRFGLIGIVVGTVVSTLFKIVFYAVYLSKHVLHRPINRFIKRITINASTFAALVASFDFLIRFVNTGNVF